MFATSAIVGSDVTRLDYGIICGFADFQHGKAFWREIATEQLVSTETKSNRAMIARKKKGDQLRALLAIPDSGG